MLFRSIEALNVAERSPDVRSVVITGAGGMFCSGGNLQRLQANRQQPPEVQAQSIEGLHQWIETIRTYPKPVIAAVEGAAAGAGFSLALACDMVVAARDAVFLMAYSNVALSPDGSRRAGVQRQRGPARLRVPLAVGSKNGLWRTQDKPRQLPFL